MDTAPPILTLADLVRRTALDPRAVKRLVRSGELERIRRGTFVWASDLGTPEGSTPAVAAHRRLLHATAPLLGEGSVVSHASAAILHGLPVESGLLERVWSIRVDSHGNRTSVLTASNARMPDEDTVVVDGVRVTSLARTLVDLMRTRPFDWGVATSDAAMRRGVEQEAVLAVLERARGVPGIRRARAAWSFADPRSESVGESRSRALLHLEGVPVPDLQREIHRDGRLVARTDFAWDEDSTVGEFDGAMKYGTLVPTGRRPEDLVMAEKAREQEIRDAGWWIVRWGWADLSRPRTLGVRVLRALDIGRRRRRPAWPDRH